MMIIMTPNDFTKEHIEEDLAYLAHQKPLSEQYSKAIRKSPCLGWLNGVLFLQIADIVRGSIGEKGIL